MARTFPTLEQTRQLPRLLEMVIPPEYEDLNGHMNIQHYLGLYDKASMPFMALLGVDETYFTVQRKGIFDLEHHLHYLAEVHIGDTVTLYGRLLARTAKRFHGMWFMVNETRQQLANTFEFVSTHTDLEARRTAPFTDELAANLDAMLAEHSTLDWKAPVCGVMGA
jgi:acyl-CoA thioester hydrolase